MVYFSDMFFRSYLTGLVVFGLFFSLSFNVAISNSWSDPQLAPGSVLNRLNHAFPSSPAQNVVNLISIQPIG